MSDSSSEDEHIINDEDLKSSDSESDNEKDSHNEGSYINAYNIPINPF